MLQHNGKFKIFEFIWHGHPHGNFVLLKVQTSDKLTVYFQVLNFGRDILFELPMCTSSRVAHVPKRLNVTVHHCTKGRSSWKDVFTTHLRFSFNFFCKSCFDESFRRFL